MCRKTLRGAAVLGLGAVLALGVGCRYDDDSIGSRGNLAVSPYEDVKLNVNASRTDAVVGEVVTFTAHTENLLGRNASVEWSAPAGEIRTQQDGRVARVIFEEPGTYSVTARLFVDDFEVRRDTKIVTVRPLR